jgi:hypothetical protein
LEGLGREKTSITHRDTNPLTSDLSQTSTLSRAPDNNNNNNNNIIIIIIITIGSTVIYRILAAFSVSYSNKYSVGLLRQGSARRQAQKNRKKIRAHFHFPNGIRTPDPSA